MSPDGIIIDGKFGIRRASNIQNFEKLWQRKIKEGWAKTDGSPLANENVPVESGVREEGR